jgi:hypothetical protein
VTYVCPNGHDSSAADFCDTCGAKIDAAAQGVVPEAEGSGAAAGAEPAAPAAPGALTCPHCGTENIPESLFCEACGYDFTTGAMPRGSEPDGAPDEAAEVPAVPEPATEGAPGGIPAPPAAAPPAAAGTGVPPAIPLEWVAEVWIDPDWYAVQEADDPMPSAGLPVVVPLTVRSALIGRVSASKQIVPDIDCTTDSGVSRRHAQLTTDGTRWFVEDLGSSNGTFVGDAGDALPDDPIAVGPKRELGDDDRIYVGAWTRIVVREATDEEKAAVAAG